MHINKIASNPCDISDVVHLVCCSNAIVSAAERS